MPTIIEERPKPPERRRQVREGLIAAGLIAALCVV